MKEVLKKVRNLQIYVTATALLLSGCSLHSNLDTREISNSQSVETNNYVSNHYVSNNYGDNETFYERTYNSAADYNKMILTLQEKGLENLSEQAKTAIQNVSFYNTNPYNFLWVESFAIDDYFSSAYTHPNVASRVSNHANSSLYNVLTHSINWKEAIDIIVQNGKQTEKDDETNTCTALSRSEVEIVISQLEKFTEDVVKEYPEYDLKHLACQLYNLSLVYRTPLENTSTLATTSYCRIDWYLNEFGQKPILQTSLMLNDHEFKHFLCGYCCDEISTGENVYITPSGVIYGANTSLNFSFIEEATAEEYSAEKNGKDCVNYYEKIAALETLKFVLSLQDDYEEDGFLKYGFLQNPLALVQQFPVLDDQTYYFQNNLKMLASFNACLSSVPYVFAKNVSALPGYENFLENFEQKKEVLSVIGTYASSELSRLFLTNLIVMNDTKDDMSVSYNFYLMRLFEKRMDIMFLAMSDYQRFNMSSANYKQIYNERLGSFFQYLSDKYQMDLADIRELYEEYSLSDGIIYPSFVDNNRQSFYRNLESQEYDNEELKKYSDNAIQYYVQYFSN